MIKTTLAVVLVLLLPGVGSSDSRDSSTWWIKNHGGVIDARDNPLVTRAERVFDKVVASADKRGNRLPRLFVIKAKGDPWALSLPDGGILLTEGALSICHSGVTSEEGDSRVAFIFGHELAHLAKDDFWHRSSFMAFNEQYDEKKSDHKAIKAIFDGTSEIKRKEITKAKELQADQNGMIYMAMAGYDPSTIIGKSNFFEEWTKQVTGRVAYTDSTHPTSKERAEFLRTQLTPVVDALDLFYFGVRLSQLEKHADATMFFETYAKAFPGREVFSNLGLSHYNLALRALAGCDRGIATRFYLSTVLDIDTYGSKFALKGGDNSECLNNKEYVNHMRHAVSYLTKAVEMDTQYVPGRINLSSALIMSGDYSKAMGIADEALKIKADNPEAVNNKAVALYLFGRTNALNDSSDIALKMLSEIIQRVPSYSRAYYNMARIQSELKRETSKHETMTRFLKQEDVGIYADAIRKELKQEDIGRDIRSARLESPVKLGNVKDSADVLRKMKVKGIKIVEFDGKIYEGGGLKVLVIDDSIEVVEQVVPKRFKMPADKPLRKVKTNVGEAYVFENFAVEMIDYQPKKLIYFMNNT
ncbi:MAG: M48 family metalloprotease [Nitrospirae bacterium]|nr:M48 family metalloprotease [Nitrospirota bacterium]